MLITSIQVVMKDTGTKLVGLANVVLDDMIVIKEIKILCNNGNFFLSMPSRTTKTGTHKDMVHPVNGTVRSLFETAVLYAFQKAKESGYQRIKMEMKNNITSAVPEFKPEEYEINYSTTVPTVYNNTANVETLDGTYLRSHSI